MSAPLPPLNHILDVACSAARAAGQVLAQGFNKPKSVNYKGEIDLVTEFDLAAEKTIISRLTEAFPGHHILAEESGSVGQTSEFIWYIDPLDGTTNFAHNFPFFCVSLALEGPGPSGREIKVGVIHDPLRDETFTAVRGGSAFLNGNPMSVTSESELGRALLATGFPYDIQQAPDPVLTRFRNVCLTARGVRRPGAAALDLAYVAAGRLDGFWEERLHPWDTAAGILLVEEAGGTVTDFKNQAYQPQAKEVLATNGLIHYNMLKILAPDYEVRKATAQPEETE